MIFTFGTGRCAESGERPAGDREDEFNPRRQITRSTLRCSSLELTYCNGPHTHTSGASLSHAVPEAGAYAGIQKTYHSGCFTNTRDHCEVRTASWKEMVRRNEGLLLNTGVTTFIVISVSPSDTDDMRQIKYMSNNQSLEPAHPALYSYFHPLFLSPLTRC